MLYAERWRVHAFDLFISLSLSATAEIFQDQVQDVLDAMFEKTVESGDYVIRQGDDGDNFYVIDR